MIRTLAVSLSVLVALVAVSPLHAEPMRFADNGHFYEAVDPFIVTWQAAKDLTESRGGYLATLTSEAENQFAFSVADDQRFWRAGLFQNFGPWIGGYQPDGSKEPGDNWQWVTGEPFEYTAWRSGEPNNQGLFKENALHFMSGAGVREPLWNDNMAGDILHGFVIEWNSFPSWRYGDFNGDLKVDLNDFGTLKMNFGRRAGPAEGNTDFDSRVDLSDFGTLKQNFGRAFTAEGPVHASPVPEPTTWLLALIAGTTLAASRRRRSRA
jgi:hypothetical protein